MTIPLFANTRLLDVASKWAAEHPGRAPARLPRRGRRKPAVAPTAPEIAQAVVDRLRDGTVHFVGVDNQQQRRGARSSQRFSGASETLNAFEVLLGSIAERVAAQVQTVQTQSARWVTTADAEELGLMSRAAFREAARQGLFPADTSGKGFRARLSDVEQFLQSRLAAQDSRAAPRRPAPPQLDKGGSTPSQEDPAAAAAPVDEVAVAIQRALDRRRLRVLPGGKGK